MNKAKRYIMIGAPVSHVRTPPLLRDFFAQQGVFGDVSAVEVSPADLAAFMRRVRSDKSVDGLLVTMPHKKTVVAFLDAISATARLAASVNAVKRTGSGELVGSQFDGIALVNTLVAKGAPVGMSRILVVGVGGAGTAIVHAFAANGCQRLDICDIDVERSEAVARELCTTCTREISATTEPNRNGYDILVNATPLGMQEGDASPFTEKLIAKASWVADIVADPPRTRLADLAREAGKHLITGRQMVEGQIGPIGRWLLAPDIEQDAGPVVTERHR